MTNNNVDIEMILPVLRQIPLFSSLDEKFHREIIQRIVLMYYPSQYDIFQENEQGDALYIIKKGNVLIYHAPKEEGLPIRQVATLKENDFFGEMALISDVPRNASARALTDCEVFILSKDDFRSLLDTNKELAEQISSIVINRINENNNNQ